MARPSAWLADLVPTLGEDGLAVGSRDHSRTGPVQASTVRVSTPTSPASVQPSQAPMTSTAPPRPHKTNRNASVASSNLDSADFVNLDLSQLQLESDSSDSDFRSSNSPAAGPSHSRSMSNPFPSFFSPKKKKKKRADSLSGFNDSGSSGDGELMSTITAIRPRNGPQRETSFSSPTSKFHGRKPSFSTGPCITCGSLMRWACGVEAFRCGICLTVNDLLPASKASVLASTSAEDAMPQDLSVSPISVEQTRNIVEECLRSYLEAVLSDAPTGPRVSSPGDKASNSKSVSAPRNLTGGRRGQTYSPSPLRAAPDSLPRVPGSQQGRPVGGNPSHHSQALSSAQAPLIYYHGPSLLPSSAAGQHFSASSAVPKAGPSPSTHVAILAARKNEEKEAKRIFRSLEDYVTSHIFSMDCLDGSFQTTTPTAVSSDIPQKDVATLYAGSSSVVTRPPVPELKSDLYRSTDIAVTGSWCTNTQGRIEPARNLHRHQSSEGRGHGISSSRPINVDWVSVDAWYDTVLNSGAAWEPIYTDLVSKGKFTRQPRFVLEQIEAQILKGQQHAQRILLKAIETVLKRPGRRISESGDFRFLIIALANPLLHASSKIFTGNYQPDEYTQHSKLLEKPEAGRGTGPASGQHSVIIKRILGLMSNSSDEWHGRMISCFARFSEARFLMTKDLVGGFLAYRLVRYNEKKEESRNTDADPLVPKVAEGASAASFHAALNEATRSTKKPKQPTEKKITHGDDWQIKAAVRVLGLLFAANNSSRCTRENSLTGANGTGSRARLGGQIVPTSDFYITLLDNCDLVADFEAWEQQTAKFTFCQYPFLLSIWAKIQILEHEARRQMKNKARDAFFDSIMTRRNYDQHLILNVRRDCLVEDSLKGVSAAIGSGTEDIKKGIRIIFNGEEGIDAGGLRKEWFLLLVREVFNPDHGMFIYDDESQYCYFNPASFETSDQFFLVGVVLGLALYNSTILDVALPPFSFRKLLLAAPALATGPGSSTLRPAISYTLADLAEYRPRLARGLQQLLDYDGDVGSVFCLEFTITVERYGHKDSVPLCPGGEARAVTNSNREEYVRLYIRYLLDTSVFRQFEPFKRGFFTVCGCNALALFRPEEIELLVRGSDEQLDVASLRLAASYENWPSPNPLENEPTIRWFWELLEDASPNDQRKILTFITGSDRIPATGPASLSIRILCLGDDTGRFPTARTCFNTLTLYRYTSKDAMRAKLWGAVNESEGFGLK